MEIIVFHYQRNTLAFLLSVFHKGKQSMPLSTKLASEWVTSKGWKLCYAERLWGTHAGDQKERLWQLSQQQDWSVLTLCVRAGLQLSFINFQWNHTLIMWRYLLLIIKVVKRYRFMRVRSFVLVYRWCHYFMWSCIHLPRCDLNHYWKDTIISAISSSPSIYRIHV